jgi:hypothetical protein
MIDEVRRYADLHGMSISEVIREGVDMRLHGTQQPSEYNSNTSLPAPTVTMLTRLTTTLTTAVDQLRSVCAGTIVSEGEERQIPSGPQADTQQSEACPHFDRTKYLLGKLCKRGHEWGMTGQSLLSVHGHTCKECKAEHKRRKRAAQHQPVQP